MPKCKIQWIDNKGNPTPDNNDAVAMAHAHKAIWKYSYGHPDNCIVGYSDEIDRSFPICQEHLDRVTADFKGWSFTALDGNK